MTMDEYRFQEDFFFSIEKRRYFNTQISAMYNQMLADEKYLSADSLSLDRKSDALENCMLDWSIDHYNDSRVKVINNVYRCKDKFCYNCQSLLALQRFYQFKPVLDSYSEENDMFHVVFTQSNVKGRDLNRTLTLMYDRFHYLIGFFNGHKKIKGIDFSKYGFKGAVRSLEVTQNRKTKLYHPHFHCIFILKKGISKTKDFEPWIYNSFSKDYSGRNKDRYFTNFEFLLQRIWCLLIMREKITLNSILNIGEILPRYPDGFSVICNLANGQYHEIFKYATKGAFKDGTMDDYEAFVTIYHALHNRRIYQTYGCLLGYDFNDVDESLGLDESDSRFNAFLQSLREREVPSVVSEKIDDIINNTRRGEKYYSKASFRKRLSEYSEQEKEN